MPSKAIKNENDIKEALKELLLDDFSVYGDDASLFAKIQEEISHNTYSILTPMCYIRVLSVLPEENQPQNGKLAVYVFGKDGTIHSFFFHFRFKMLFCQRLIAEHDRCYI